GSPGWVDVFLGNGDGSFGGSNRVEGDMGGFGAFGLAVGDFNGDGHPDLVTTDLVSDVGAALGGGGRTFQAPVGYQVGDYSNQIQPLRPVVGDFNGDGKLDIAVGTNANTPLGVPPLIHVLPGNGDGTFGQAVDTITAFRPLYLDVG